MRNNNCMCQSIECNQTYVIENSGSYLIECRSEMLCKDIWILRLIDCTNCSDEAQI